MDTSARNTRAALAGAVGLAALASALFVERRSRAAERDHHAPHHLIYIQGTRLHYRLVGNGPPVLLVHGNLVDGADFEVSGLVERLARHYQVLVIDRPGFGHSARPRGPPGRRPGRRGSCIRPRRRWASKGRLSSAIQWARSWRWRWR
jgi:pimeloyl-ACP methyl ester carboxylesterase